MRNNYEKNVITGDAGRDWYGDASDTIRSVTRDDLDAQKMADTLGITSASTGVDTNLGFTVKAMNQRAAGLPVKTGRFPGNMSPLVEDALNGVRNNLGAKRLPFADNLSVSWNPELGSRPVHDIWQGRAFGYTHPDGKPWDAGFSPQQHAFMDENQKFVADRLNRGGKSPHEDWDALKTQAAAWTGAKIKAGDVKLEDAAKHYGDFLDKYKAHGTHEQIPAAGGGQLEGMALQPSQAKQQFSDATSWDNPRGQDSLYSDIGIPTGPSNDALGYFTPQGTGLLETNPARIANPHVSMVENASGNKRVSPESRGLLDAVESLRAYVDHQTAGAWHKTIPTNKAGDFNSIVLNKKLSPEELKQLGKFANENGFFPIQRGDTTVLMHDPYSGITRTGKDLAKELKKGALKDELAKYTNDVHRAFTDSGYLDYEDAVKSQGTGESTRQLFSDLDASPGARDSLTAGSAAGDKALANMARDDAWSKKTGLPIREDVQRAREILAKGGLKALRKALDAGAILPSALLALGVSRQMLMDDENTL